MAVIKPPILLADGHPATVGQVIEVCTHWPTQSPYDLKLPCFPGYLANCADREEWKRRDQEMEALVDERMQVLHLANLICRVAIKDDRRLRVSYRRPSDRYPVVVLTPEQAALAFRDIKPGADPRFPPRRPK